MNPRKILIVFKKELKESFRDKTTIFVSYILPFIIYPLVTLVLSVVVGIKIDNISSEKYNIIILKENKNLELKALNTSKFNILEGQEISLKFKESKQEKDRFDLMKYYMSSNSIDSIIILKTLGNNIRADIIFNSVKKRSIRASKLLQIELSKIASIMLEKRIKKSGKDEGFLTPLLYKERDLAPAEIAIVAKGGFSLVFITIYLLILGMYNPIAVSTIGEKDRGTLLVVLGTAINTIDLILGKFLNVLIHGFLTIFSYAAVSIIILKSMSLGKLEILKNLNALSSPLTFVVGLILLSILLAATAFMVTGFAKNMSQSGSLMTFLMLFGMGPAILVKLYEVKESFLISLLPVSNLVVLMEKSLYQNVEFSFLVSCFFSTFVWTGLFLTIYVLIFKKFQVYS